MNKPLKVEFHCHTWRSRDSVTSPRELQARARRLGIDRVIITDHNTIRGGLEACELDPELFIVGEEVLTDKGEFLAAFVTHEVPARLPYREALDRLRSQGAFISVSHPFDYSRYGWHEPDLLEIMSDVDAIEVFNSRCVSMEINDRAAMFASDHQLAGTVGSDAHLVRELGRATLTLPYFSTADELRGVIRMGTATTSLSSGWVHAGSAFARMARRWKKIPE